MVAFGGAAPARAQGRDWTHGRVEGDLELRAHAGAAFAAGGPALAASLAALYVSTVGVYVHYTDALGSDAPHVTRSLAAGLHMAPLFVMRGWSNAERGPAFVDLLIDSFALELGAVWREPRGSTWGVTPGLEVALGVAVPLLGRATGPYLGFRAALRWRPEDFAPPPVGVQSGVADRGAVLSLTLGWHHVLRVHIVDAGDRVTR